MRRMRARQPCRRAARKDRREVHRKPQRGELQRAPADRGDAGHLLGIHACGPLVSATENSSSIEPRSARFRQLGRRAASSAPTAMNAITIAKYTNANG